MAKPDHSFLTQKAVLDDLIKLRCTANLSTTALELLASFGAKRKLSANQYIFEEGEPGDFFAIIVQGLVEGTRYSQNDGDTIIGIFGPSDLIGLPAVIRNSTYPGSARTLSNKTEIIKFYIRPLLQDQSSEALEVHAWIREMLLLYSQILHDKIDILNAGRVENRILELLKHLIRRFGEQKSPTLNFIPIQLTRAQIARIINVRIETVIRILSQWRKKQLIQWTPEGIQIHHLSLLEKDVYESSKKK